MSYEQIINQIFDYCVDLLVVSARHVGMTYEEINVWFFIVFEPIIFALVALYAIHQRKQIQLLRNRLNPVENKAHDTDDCSSGYLVSSGNSR